MRHRLAHLPLPPSRLRSRPHLYCSSAMRLIACGLRLACLDQDRQSKFVLPLLPSRSLESLYSQDRESHTPPPNEPFQLRGLETSHGPVNYASASLTEEQVGNSTSDPDAPSWIESVDNCTWACERYLIFFICSTAGHPVPRRWFGQSVVLHSLIWGLCFPYITASSPDCWV